MKVVEARVVGKAAVSRVGSKVEVRVEVRAAATAAAMGAGEMVV